MWVGQAVRRAADALPERLFGGTAGPTVAPRRPFPYRACRLAGFVVGNTPRWVGGLVNLTAAWRWQPSLLRRTWGWANPLHKSGCVSLASTVQAAATRLRGGRLRVCPSLGYWRGPFQALCCLTLRLGTGRALVARHPWHFALQGHCWSAFPHLTPPRHVAPAAAGPAACVIGGPREGPLPTAEPAVGEWKAALPLWRRRVTSSSAILRRLRPLRQKLRRRRRTHAASPQTRGRRTRASWAAR